MVSKAQARANTLQTRSARSDSERELCSQGFAAHDWLSILQGDTVSLYVSMASEPPTGPLRTLLRNSAKTIVLPIMGPQRSLAWGFDTGMQTTNSFGVAEPEIDIAIQPSSFQTMIIPAQRAGRDGSRLGRGAGYYDRVLATLPVFDDGGPLRITLVFDDEVDDVVPTDEWDQKVNVIVTPTRVLHISE